MSRLFFSMAYLETTPRPPLLPITHLRREDGRHVHLLVVGPEVRGTQGRVPQDSDEAYVPYAGPQPPVPRTVQLTDLRMQMLATGVLGMLQLEYDMAETPELERHLDWLLGSQGPADRDSRAIRAVAALEFVGRDNMDALFHGAAARGATRVGSVS